uniref:Uncharacterized protein n=1 Tax=Knipowitschia caucasica TaxID=637954 RepID=A0AAV2M557_KNICA
MERRRRRAGPSHGSMLSLNGLEDGACVWTGSSAVQCGMRGTARSDADAADAGVLARSGMTLQSGLGALQKRGGCGFVLAGAHVITSSRRSGQ